MVALLICSLLTIGYLALIIAYCKGWAMQQPFILQQDFLPRTTISVIIPARNEASNIEACLSSIISGRYPAHLLEIIVVDDHSTDGTAGIVQNAAASNIRCISLADYLDPGKPINAYKKAAIAAGIKTSKSELIVTTDADCIAPDGWLLNMAAAYEQRKPAMIVAPVIYSSDRSLVQIFQLIDFMGMQGITAAAHSLKLGNMSNGANLAFSRAAYIIVNGYEGIMHLASGDDYLLMMKINKSFPGGIAYLSAADTIVVTAPQPGWRSFLQQRIRWASKSGKYADARLTGILLLVYVFNVAILALAIAGIFRLSCLLLAGSMLAIKIVAEYIFLRPVAAFFNKQWALRYFPLLQPLHVIYIVLAGFLGLVGGYKWKGREVK
jgi:cellulose synthase/poly-beta-1,6-N-acetylglucosamine synthase-like glycosyltransferase